MGQVINLMIKGIRKDFKKNMIKALAVSFVILILNFILLSKFQKSGLGPYLSSTLAIPGNRLGGTLFWSLAGANVVNVFSKLKNKKQLFIWTRIKPASKSVLSFSENEFKLAYIIGITLAILFSNITGSVSFSLLAAITFFSSSVQIKKSKLAFVLNMIFGRLMRAMFKKKGNGSINSLMSGSTLGFMFYGLLNGNEIGLFIGLALIILFIVINVMDIFKKKKKNGEEI
ncbi:hypothetical protein [Clostridium sp. DL1XJH146]